jgi:hypothetical protein
MTTYSHMGEGEREGGARALCAAEHSERLNATNMLHGRRCMSLPLLALCCAVHSLRT